MNALLRIVLVTVFSNVCQADDKKAQESKFFPPKTFSDDQMVDDFVDEIYTGSLKQLNEMALPPLAKDKDAIIYRFTCIRSFKLPFSIRISRTKDGFKLLRTLPSYQPGKATESVESDLKIETVSNLEKLLLEIKFKELNAVEGGGLDGSHWILEVVKDGEYKIVDRWSPKGSSAMRQIGDWFFTTSKWKPEEPN